MKRFASVLVVLLAASTIGPTLAQSPEPGSPPLSDPDTKDSVPPDSQVPPQQQRAGDSTQVDTQPHWVSAGAPNGATDQRAPSSQQKIQATFPPSSYGAGNYAVAGQPSTNPQSFPANQNGGASMPALTPPSNFQQAEQLASPFSAQEIIQLRNQLDGVRRAKSYRPVQTVPRVSSTTVDLSGGVAIPIVRTMPGEISTLVFLDSTGAPWPLAAPPRVSDPRFFSVEWLSNTHVVVISVLAPYEAGNLTVFLHGLATPVVLKLSAGETNSKAKSRVVDYRLDLRVPGRGPNARSPLLEEGKIGLYDDTLQAFLDGIPPRDAKKVKVHSATPIAAQVWQYGGDIFIRTVFEIQTAFDQSIASADGTRVYRLPPTPYITLSEMGRSITLQLDIN